VIDVPGYLSRPGRRKRAVLRDDGPVKRRLTLVEGAGQSRPGGMAEKSTPEGAEALEQLQTTLEAALGLANELAGDELLGRIISVFRAMPTQDRPVIIGVLEREVTGRLLSRATEKPVGQSTHPNPNARLYVRAHDSVFDQRHFDRDEMMIADIRAMRIACLIRNVPEIYSTWKAAIREAMDHVDESTRRVAEELLHDVLAAIADARTADPPAVSDETPDAGEGNKRS